MALALMGAHILVTPVCFGFKFSLQSYVSDGISASTPNKADRSPCSPNLLALCGRHQCGRDPASGRSARCRPWGQTRRAFSPPWRSFLPQTQGERGPLPGPAPRSPPLPAPLSSPLPSAPCHSPAGVGHGESTGRSEGGLRQAVCPHLGVGSPQNAWQFVMGIIIKLTLMTSV